MVDLVADSVPAPQSIADGWSWPRLLAFRFLFIYLVLYLPPNVSWVFPWLGWIATGYDAVAHPVVVWVAERLFHVQRPITVFNGDDSTYNYLLVLVIGISAAIGCGAWSIAGRRRRSHPRLHDGLRLAVRYCLAASMLNYGFAKVIGIQFPSPLLDRLLEPYGQGSPMGLLWTFMGHSKGYNIFTGSVEVIGAMLLFWERTTLCGTLLLTSALTNVVVLNLAYDVPIKLYSIHLLLFTVYLMLPDVRRLWAFLLWDRYVPRRVFHEPWRSLWGRRVSVSMKAAVICTTLVVIVRQDLEIVRSIYGPIARRYGIYEVDSFVENGELRPPQFGDETRWRRVIINQDGRLSVQTMDDAVVQWRTTERVPERTFELSGTRYPRDPTRRAVLRYTEPEPGRLTLEGTYDGRSIDAHLRKTPLPSFVLLNRGFHWINEYHYNR